MPRLPYKQGLAGREHDVLFMMQQHKWGSHHKLQLKENRKFLHHEYTKKIRSMQEELSQAMQFIQKVGLLTTFCSFENLRMPALRK